MEIIHWMITIIVLWIMFLILRWIILPHLRVGVYALPPTQLWVTIWRIIIQICMAVFHYILAALVFLWVLYLIIKKYVPNFPIPLRRILLAIPPFPQLESAGIFDLFSGIWDILMSTKSIQERVYQAGDVTSKFIIKNVDLALSTVGLNNVVKRVELYARTGSASLPPEPERGGSKPSPPNQFEPSEQHIADEAYQQCMEENVAVITDDMTETEAKFVSAQNNVNKIICKTKYLQAYASLISV